MNLRSATLALEAALGRPILWDGWRVIQKCPLCEVELQLYEPEVEGLAEALFAFYDAHRCYARPDEDTYQRAERAFVRMGERVLALENTEGASELARRAERECQRLASWVEAYTKR